MKPAGILIEKSEYGTRAILAAPFSRRMREQLQILMPEELEPNSAKGWSGDDVDFVGSLPWLKSLIIIKFPIDNVDAIHSLHNLINLKVITYCSTEIDFSAFPFLERCALEWRPKARSVFDCQSLRHLFVNRYKGKSIEPFTKLTGLETLGILNAPISDLRGVGRLKHLRKLRLGNLRTLKSLEGLDELGELEELTLQGCRKVEDIAPLSKLHNLKILNISENGNISSLKPIEPLEKLIALFFYGSTKIMDGDLQPLVSKTGLTNLAFQNRRHYSHKREDFEAYCPNNGISAQTPPKFLP